MICVLFALLVILAGLLGGIGVLVFFGWRRMQRHLQQNPGAAQLLADHIIVPLLSGSGKPEPKKVKATLI